MASNSEPHVDSTIKNEFKTLNSEGLNWLSILLLTIIIATFGYFYCIIPIFGNFREQSVVEWIWAVCGKKEYDYGHGRFVPLVILFLIFRSRKQIVQCERSSEWWGLAFLFLGMVFYVVSVRTIQARIAAGSIPFIIYGLIAFIYGRKTAKYFIFPLALLYFAIPLPGLTQATNGLQILATKIAYHLSTLFGADVTAAGTEIQSTNENWDALKIAEGCSGVRSLIALVFVASVYGYVTQNKIWKFVIMVMSSLPLAIIANSIRVTTIVLIAEFWDAEFAARTYHNFSGFLFFPLGIIGIILIGFLLNSGWKSKQKVISRQLVSGKDSNGKDTQKIKGDDT
tara:strand:+ start:445 stop:1464 length:1020 start_codon:yes stop_codon:yes gene_type:complete